MNTIDMLDNRVKELQKWMDENLPTHTTSFSDGMRSGKRDELDFLLRLKLQMIYDKFPVPESSAKG